MKFDRRVTSNIVLILLLTLVAGVTAMCQANGAVKIGFGEELMAVYSKDYRMNIPYADMVSVELTEDPELGSVTDGKNRPELRSGIWENDAWGEYHLCANPKSASYIVVHLSDGQVFVFNCNTDEKTAEIYQQILTYLPENTAE